MNKYRLKAGQEAFAVVDGPLAGRQFSAGTMYDQIPEAEADRFEVIEPEKPKAKSRKKKEA